jgi:hypothetical protein
MLIHQALAERLIGVLGEPVRKGSEHSWRIPAPGASGSTINVILDLPSTARPSRIWVFDPHPTEKTLRSCVWIA